MENDFKCSCCKDTKIDTLMYLTEYGDRYYNMDIKYEEYCESCFKDLQKQFTTPIKTNDEA